MIVYTGSTYEIYKWVNPIKKLIVIDVSYNNTILYSKVTYIYI